MEKERDLNQQEGSATAETAPAETPVMETAEQNGSATPATPPAEAGPTPAELQERFLRLAADFANYKRRSENERAEIADWARRDFALSLLPILDDFGLMAEYEATDPERLAEGAKLIRQKTLDLVIKHGLEKIEALNQPYDYAAHEAVLTRPVPDPALDHVVLSVMQDGYRFKGKVLRPSKVMVGQYVEKDAPASGTAKPESTEPNGESYV